MSRPRSKPDVSGASTATGSRFVPGQTSAALAPPPQPPAKRARLDAALPAMLARGIHGLCSRPRFEGQRPGSPVSEAQIREHLAICRPHTRSGRVMRALPYMQQRLTRTRCASGGKRMLMSETGRFDQGSAFQGAVPGHEAGMQYIVDTAAWAQPANGGERIEWIHFAAFDEAWKLGATWGLWHQDARPKFA